MPNHFNGPKAILHKDVMGKKSTYPFNKSGSQQTSALPMKTASWPGLPGKAQPSNRSGGTPQESVYAKAVGLAGGKDNDAGESKES